MEQIDGTRADILIVDDQPEILLILEEFLGERYNVYPAAGGRRALEYLNAGGAADLILLDVMMPGMNGFEVCKRLKASESTRDIPVIFLSSLDSASDEEHGLTLGAEDFIHKPFSPPVALARVRNHLRLRHATKMLKTRNDDLEHLVSDRTRELIRRSQQLEAAQSATITAFCSLAEQRDNETGNHIRRTQNYVRALAHRLRNHPRFRDTLDDETIQLLFKSAPLHDVGKVAIPDAILLKSGKLTPQEWEVMKMHVNYGRDAIVSAEAELGGEQGSFLRYAREIAAGHHERWDGTGYPEGLRGDDIPVSARLMAIADVYDALISERVYKKAFTHEHALSIIAEGRGTHFDPDMTDAALDIAEEFGAIARRYSDTPQTMPKLMTLVY